MAAMLGLIRPWPAQAAPVLLSALLVALSCGPVLVDAQTTAPPRLYYAEVTFRNLNFSTVLGPADGFESLRFGTLFYLTVTANTVEASAVHNVSVLAASNDTIVRLGVETSAQATAIEVAAVRGLCVTYNSQRYCTHLDNSPVVLGPSDDDEPLEIGPNTKSPETMQSEGDGLSQTNLILIVAASVLVFVALVLVWIDRVQKRRKREAAAKRKNSNFCFDDILAPNDTYQAKRHQRLLAMIKPGSDSLRGPQISQQVQAQSAAAPSQPTALSQAMRPMLPLPITHPASVVPSTTHASNGVARPQPRAPLALPHHALQRPAPQHRRDYHEYHQPQRQATAYGHLHQRPHHLPPSTSEYHQPQQVPRQHQHRQTHAAPHLSQQKYHQAMAAADDGGALPLDYPHRPQTTEYLKPATQNGEPLYDLASSLDADSLPRKRYPVPGGLPPAPPVPPATPAMVWAPPPIKSPLASPSRAPGMVPRTRSTAFVPFSRQTNDESPSLWPAPALPPVPRPTTSDYAASRASWGTVTTTPSRRRSVRFAGEPLYAEMGSETDIDMTGYDNADDSDDSDE
ncbi:uncharacterized protein MONBRDRAFT_11957 [Monosiga brevicollis MX1]|uniref:Cadherin domain-containing protein n=1 Tax=Monosiga brevicollis TaxID=81824 RepID=A9VAT2_MONBE|nr:uncharacterized protein MONBRDRAFT_11957 [Monosiga brevicollis MX1]EDQ85375.1 predicted protein [Monosiga brevicollis MX1]|eukprot:XP_001749786.1 hypothetical protein [Monosiga brevicollis MX1]